MSRPTNIECQLLARGVEVADASIAHVHLVVVVNRFPTLSESFIFKKVMELRARGVDVHVLVHSHSNDRGHYTMPINQHDVGVVYSPLADGLTHLPFALLSLIARNPIRTTGLLRRALAQYGPSRCAIRAWVQALPLVLGDYNLIHFEFSGLAASYLDALPLLAPAKIIVSCRGASEQITPLIRPERALELRRVFAQASRVHCVTADMLRSVQQYGLLPEQGFVNYPSIDVELFRRRHPYIGRTSGTYRLLSVGRLHWKKGLEYAILTVRVLLDEGYDICYEIIGSGQEEERLRFMIRELGLEGHVHLKGAQSAEDVRLALEEADIYLLPSVSEGLSNAALEAMAMEIPVIVTEVGGMAEAITDGCEGYLVPPWQSHPMAEKIRTLIGDVDLRCRMGQAGRGRVEAQFNLQHQINVFIDQYQSLINTDER
jgi:colanic acid/amylovoran biosynthesis glycosyltransferase